MHQLMQRLGTSFLPNKKKLTSIWEFSTLKTEKSMVPLSANLLSAGSKYSYIKANGRVVRMKKQNSTFIFQTFAIIFRYKQSCMHRHGKKGVKVPRASPIIDDESVS